MTNHEKQLQAARTSYAKYRRQAIEGGLYADKKSFDDAATKVLELVSGGEDGEGVELSHWVESARRLVEECEPKAQPARDMCGRCGGTGIFHTVVLNGKPVSRGECFRCQGKGFQTDGDRRRNYGYDVYAPKYFY